MVELLLERCPDLINARAGNLQTPLHVAAASKVWEKKIEDQHTRADLVRLLVEKGAQLDKKEMVNAKDENGNTPLHETVAILATHAEPDLEIIQLLINAGATPLPNNKEQTPLQFAQEVAPEWYQKNLQIFKKST